MDAIDELQGGGAVRAQRGDLAELSGVEQRPQRRNKQAVTPLYEEKNCRKEWREPRQ